jgi:hypothetical protein
MISMKRCAAGSPFNPMSRTCFERAIRSGLLPSRTGLGGARKTSLGTGRRFDSIWISRHWIVRRVEHMYEEGIGAGSDHAPVVVDLDLAIGKLETNR